MGFSIIEASFEEAALRMRILPTQVNILELGKFVHPDRPRRRQPHDRCQRDQRGRSHRFGIAHLHAADIVRCGVGSAVTGATFANGQVTLSGTAEASSTLWIAGPDGLEHNAVAIRMDLPPADGS